jgi:hypothetical protein
MLVEEKEIYYIDEIDLREFIDFYSLMWFEDNEFNNMYDINMNILCGMG